MITMKKYLTALTLLGALFATAMPQAYAQTTDAAPAKKDGQEKSARKKAAPKAAAAPAEKWRFHPMPKMMNSSRIWAAPSRQNLIASSATS